MTLLFTLLACAEVVQTPACADYVECLAARDAQLGTTTDVVRFEADGGCWGGEDGAALCDRACTAGIAWLREAYDDLPAECAP